MGEHQCPLCGTIFMGEGHDQAEFDAHAAQHAAEIAAAEQRGFRRGAEEMRERAAAMIDTSAHGSRWPERIRSLAIGRG